MSNKDQSLRQCIATKKFITESEKEAILNYLETTEEADLTVRGLMAGSQSVTSFRVIAAFRMQMCN